MDTTNNVSSGNPLARYANNPKYQKYAQQNAEYVRNNPISGKPSRGLNTNSNVSSSDNPLFGGAGRYNSYA